MFKKFVRITKSVALSSWTRLTIRPQSFILNAVNPLPLESLLHVLLHVPPLLPLLLPPLPIPLTPEKLPSPLLTTPFITHTSSLRFGLDTSAVDTCALSDVLYA